MNGMLKRKYQSQLKFKQKLKKSRFFLYYICNNKSLKSSKYGKN